MRPVDNETRITMNSRRNFVNYAHMVLSDGQELYLTPSDFRISGNNFTDDAVDGEAFQIGTAIGKTATILLDNTDGRTEIVDGVEVVYPHGKFSEYDFYMAYFELSIRLPKATHYGTSVVDQVIPIGTFTVTTPTSHGTTIEIIGVDNMYLFDRSFDDCTLDFSTRPSLKTILNRCCTDCGVPIGYTNFANENLTVSAKPENTTYRQVVSWIATIAGCNAKINVTGALTLTSYDMSMLNNLDGGSFVYNGSEYLYMNKYTWSSGASTGYNMFYARIPRTGKYKITKVVVSDIVDPSTFDGYFEVCEYNSFRDSVNNGVDFSSADGRYNRILIKHLNLVAGDNEVDVDIDITALNRFNFWSGIGSSSGTGSKFSATTYIRPLTFTDGDSADGGTFEPEWRFGQNDWVKSSGGFIDGDIRWHSYLYRCPQIIGPAGKYKVTRIYVDNIVSTAHFNGLYRIQKSVDAGTTWTTEDSGTLVAGDNIINFPIQLPNSNDTQYRVSVGQDIIADTNASSFRATHYFKADDDLYLDGDNFDGGNFTTPLGYHNLTAINGTSIGTDDIQITGVSVSYEDTSANYPTTSGWDYYALEITENPFVAGHEATVAQTIYEALSGLKFRPFTTSSIQDPTIEAGDSCVVYDVKGNMYNSIITNVVFNTGGMTELSCHAEPPTRQGARYSAPVAVRKVANEMTTYQSQQAHFNEIANAALGYYKTEIVDADTGALTTYLHDQASLDSSRIVIKIANRIIAISDNYDTDRTWNSGYDASTSTMLLNLIYVHGLTADWINTGVLYVGGLNNEDGQIFVTTRSGWTNNSYTLTSSDTYCYFFVGPTQINKSGSYKIFYTLTNFESGKTRSVKCQIQKRDQWTGSTYTWKVLQDYYPLTSNSGELPITFDVDTTNGDKYYYVVFSRTATTNAGFTATLTYNKINTTINKDGINTSNITITGIGGINVNNAFTVSSAGAVEASDMTITGGAIKLNGKNTYSTNAYGAYLGSAGISFGLYYSGHSDFEVDASNGKMFARKGQIGCYTINSVDGFKYSTDDYYCEYSYYKFHIGGRWSNSYWTFCGVGNKGEFLHLDYGASGTGGLWVTKNGRNDLYDFSGNNMKVSADNISSSVNGNPIWDGSDRKLKQNIEDLTIEEAEDLIYNVQPRKFEFKHNPDKKRYGFVAQELKEILPENSGIEYVDEDMDICCVQYIDFIAPLCMIVREQQTEIDDLKERIKALEDIVNAKLK